MRWVKWVVLKRIYLFSVHVSRMARPRRRMRIVRVSEGDFLSYVSMCTLPNLVWYGKVRDYVRSQHRMCYVTDEEYADAMEILHTKAEPLVQGTYAPDIQDEFEEYFLQAIHACAKNDYDRLDGIETTVLNRAIEGLLSVDGYDRVCEAMEERFGANEVY